MPRITSFWETILLDARSYGGGAFRPHLELNLKARLKRGHFERWLALWDATVDELFEGERAELAKAHAPRVAQPSRRACGRSSSRGSIRTRGRRGQLRSSCRSSSTMDASRDGLTLRRWSPARPTRSTSSMTGARAVRQPGGARDPRVRDERELLGRPSHATIHHSHPDGTPFPEEECPLLEPRTNRRDRSASTRTGSSAATAHSCRSRTRRRRCQSRWSRRRRRVPRHYAADRCRAGPAQARRDRSERARRGAARLPGADRRCRPTRSAAGSAATSTTAPSSIWSMSRSRCSWRRRRSPEPELAALIAQALGETRHAIEDLRELAAGLVPSVLVHRGLRGAIESLTARAPLPVALELDRRALATRRSRPPPTSSWPRR